MGKSILSCGVCGVSGGISSQNTPWKYPASMYHPPEAILQRRPVFGVSGSYGVFFIFEKVRIFNLSYKLKDSLFPRKVFVNGNHANVNKFAAIRSGYDHVETPFFQCLFKI
jgi:hypothetical protein